MLDIDEIVEREGHYIEHQYPVAEKQSPQGLLFTMGSGGNKVGFHGMPWKEKPEKAGCDHQGAGGDQEQEGQVPRE